MTDLSQRFQTAVADSKELDSRPDNATMLTRDYLEDQEGVISLARRATGSVTDRTRRAARICARFSPYSRPAAMVAPKAPAVAVW